MSEPETSISKPLRGQTVVLGITGSIAAYKGAEVARRLMDLGADVHATLTRSAALFITPLTLRTLTGNPVIVDMFDEPQQWEVQHVSLAQRAAAVVIAPATANVISKLAHGIADEFILALCLATKSPLFVAPAMNTNMYDHPAIQESLGTLRSRGAHIIEPADGRLASGASGKGRLADPAAIAQVVADTISPRDLEGLAVLVTAGPTREPLDVVRFLSNRSSGKMGYALAAAASRRGADVTLVTGPTALADPPGCSVVRVTTAAQMREAVLGQFPRCDVLIAAAAVSDYAPEQTSAGKMKKQQKPITVELRPTPDILAECGEQRRKDQLLVGFAAETDDLLAHAKEKLAAKHLDMIVANDVSKAGTAFDSDRNAGYLLFADGRAVELPEADKLSFAEQILEAVVAARPKGR